MQSVHGAIQTILDGSGTGRTVVGITAERVRFGGSDGRGFLVTGSSRAGIDINADRGVVVAGNIAESNHVGIEFGDGFRVTRGSGHVLTGNVATGNGRGFALFGDRLTVTRNVAVGNSSFGIGGDGSRYVMQLNVAHGNTNGSSWLDPATS